MGGRKLAVNTTTLDESGHMVTFSAGTVVSAEVAKGITNPKVWDDGDQPNPTPAPAPAKKTTAKRVSSSKTEK